MARSKSKLEAALDDKGPGEAPAKSSAPEEIEEVEIPEEGDDDEGGGEPQAEARETREDRKRDRGRRYNEERERDREEREQLRAQNERLIREIEASRRSAPPPQPKSLDEDEQIKRLNERRLKLIEDRKLLGERIALYGGKMSDAQQDDILKKAEAIDDELYEARAEIRERKRELTTPKKEELPEAITYMRAKYHHVLRVPAAARYAHGIYNTLVAKGKPESPDTIEDAYREAEREFRLGNTDASAGQRAKYTGGTIGGGGGSNTGPRTLKMTEDRKRNADAMFPQIKDERKRYEMYAKKVGPKILARESAKK